MKSFYLSLQTVGVTACIGFTIACMAALLDGQLRLAMLDLGGFITAYAIYSLANKAS
jgi:hypothetical protein